MLKLQCWTPGAMLPVSGTVEHKYGSARLALSRVTKLKSLKIE